MSEPQRKIVLLGKTADGKSSTGNTILEEDFFKANAFMSRSSKCISRDGMVDGRKIRVIDTPGFFDTECDDTKIKREIIKSLTECAPSIDAFVIVLKVGRYTRQEIEVVQQLLNTFEENVLKHAVILFTFGEQLEDQTIEDFIKDSLQLKELVKKFKSRCHVIDNKYWNECHSGYKSNRVQVKNLLDTIDKMVQENGCYTDNMFHGVEEEIAENAMNNNKENLPTQMKRGIMKVFCIAIQFARENKSVLKVTLFGISVAIVSGAVINLLLKIIQGSRE